MNMYLNMSMNMNVSMNMNGNIKVYTNTKIFLVGCPPFDFILSFPPFQIKKVKIICER